MRIRACAVVAIGAMLAAAGPACGQSWKEIKSDHFVIRYAPGSAADGGTDVERFADEVAHLAEKYYARIAEDLGYPRHSEFWTWDNRVKILLYPDKPSYVTQGQNAAWSEGVANYTKREIASYAGSGRFLAHILPHEMAHLIFRDFVGFKGEIPLWLDEGVAQWSEEALRPEVKRIIAGMYNKDVLLTINDMMTIDVRRLGNQNLFIRPVKTREGKEATMFLSPDALINTYYAQSASLVGFLIERYGSSDFASFCREIRDGKSVEDAVRSVYYSHIRSLEELETEWRKFIAQNA